MSLLEMQAKREDNGKELRCDASNPAVEGIMADSTTITIECKLHLSPVAVSLCAPPTKQKKKSRRLCVFMSSVCCLARKPELSVLRFYFSLSNYF